MGKCKLHLEWLDRKDENGYIINEWGRRHSDEEIFCLLCNVTFSISAKGFQAISQHASTARHKKFCETNLHKKQLRLAAVRPNCSGSTSTTVCAEVVPIAEKTLQVYSVRDSCTAAEIYWVLKCVASNYSFSSCDGIGDLFDCMFSDNGSSKITGNFTLSSTKARYLLTDALSPYFQKLLLDDLTGAYYSISYDETTNNASKKELQVAVRYWSEKKNQIVCQHLQTYFIGSATAEVLAEKVNAALDSASLPRQKFVMLGSDGPNVNKKTVRLINEELMSIRKKSLLDIGTCNIHILHNAFLSGLAALGENASDLVMAVHDFFSGWPARWEDYTVLQTEQNIPNHSFIKHVSSRWLTLEGAAARLIEQWEVVNKYFLSFVPKKKSDLTKSAKYKRIVELLKKPTMKAELLFVTSSARLFTRFTGSFQKEEPMIHVMFDEINTLAKTLVAKVCKPDSIKELGVCETVLKPEHLLPAREVQVSDEISVELSKTMQQLCNSTGEVQKLLASLKEVALKYQYVTQLLSIDMQLNEAGKAYEEKRYVDTACSLKELLGLLKTVSKTESPEIFKALSTERVYIFERFMYDMTQAWGSCLSLEETDLADGGKLARLTIRTDRKEELGQVFQALDSFDHVDFVLGKFSAALMSRILEPVVRNRSHARQATEENSATLEVKTLPGTAPPKYNDVMQSLTTVFRFLSAHLNIGVGPEATLLSRVGEVVGEEFCASLVEHCVSHLVPGQQSRDVELVAQVREVLVGLQTQLKLSRFLDKDNTTLAELAANMDQLCSGKQCQQLLDRARTIMKKDLHDMVRIGPQPPKTVPQRKKTQSVAKAQNGSPPTKEQTKPASTKNKNKGSSKSSKDESSPPGQSAACPVKCENKTKGHGDASSGKSQGEACTAKQDRDPPTPVTELKTSVVNVEKEASVKDANLFKILGFTKPEVEQTLDTFHLPECLISKSTEELMGLVSHVLEQVSHNTGSYAVRLFLTTRNIFELYMAVVPVHHRKFLETIPQHVALFHNNCMYLAHRLMTLGLECQRTFPEEVLKENTVTYVDLAQKLRHLGAEQFLAQMRAQRDNILEILRGSGLSTLGENPHLSPQTEKSVRQCLRQFEFLGTVWRGVLPTNVYDKSLGCLVNSFLEDIVVHIVKAEDIPAETAVELANVFELVQNRVPTVFADKTDLRKHVKLWTKFGELVVVLRGTLREIEDRWGAGKGPAAQVFTPNELKQLVRALFQNTERRAALLTKIK